MRVFWHTQRSRVQLRGWTRWGVLVGNIIAILLITTSVLAQTGAQLYLQVVSASEETLVVDLMVDGVTNLYGAEIKLTYDPAVVAVQDMEETQRGVQLTPGSLLSPERGSVLANQANPAEGTIVYAVTLLKPAPPVSGSGLLARIILQRLEDRPTVLDFAYARLVSADLQAIPAQTKGLTIGAFAPERTSAIGYAAGPSLTAGVEGESFPWWLVAVVIIVLGVLTFGAIMIMEEDETPSDALKPPVEPSVEQVLEHLLSTQQKAGSKE